VVDALQGEFQIAIAARAHLRTPRRHQRLDHPRHRRCSLILDVPARPARDRNEAARVRQRNEPVNINSTQRGSDK
jgi:hypothetical protein